MQCPHDVEYTVDSSDNKDPELQECIKSMILGVQKLDKTAVFLLLHQLSFTRRHTSHSFFLPDSFILSVRQKRGNPSIHFPTTWPTQGYGGSGVYAGDYGCKAGWATNPSQGIHTPVTHTCIPMGDLLTLISLRMFLGFWGRMEDSEETERESARQVASSSTNEMSHVSVRQRML